MEFEKNTMLFGADPTPRIVAIELGETGTVKVYRREKDGSTIVEVEPFHPFVWADSDVVDLGIEAEKLEAKMVHGEGTTRKLASSIDRAIDIVVRFHRADAKLRKKKDEDL